MLIIVDETKTKTIGGQFMPEIITQDESIIRYITAHSVSDKL
ncbi:hypothetical protein [Clostridium sp. OS1-26]|nr:hypothetical protein [Clostridium sp. OS1-26]WML35554.1 hypothetical protein RCG18_02005 [Clostridium sp. OS1-26]